MNNVETEEVKVTKLLGVTLDCKLSWSKHMDATLAKICFLDITINKTSLTGPSFVTPGLMPSHMDKCHKEEHMLITFGPEQSSTAGP